jgi:TfoX/Sxy family transcriptional regulator of competence genes
MASSVDTVLFIVDQASLGRRLQHRKMFGEYALYVDGKVVALVCDDTLFLKPTPVGRALLKTVKEAPPYPGAKNHFVLEAELDDSELLREAFVVTADALPAPKPKGAAPRAKKKR